MQEIINTQNLRSYQLRNHKFEMKSSLSIYIPPKEIIYIHITFGATLYDRSKVRVLFIILSGFL